MGQTAIRKSFENIGNRTRITSLNLMKRLRIRSGARYIFIAMIFGFRIQKAFFANAF